MLSFVRKSLFAKVMGLAVLILAFIGIVEVLSFVEFAALEARDDVRVLTITMGHIEQAEDAFVNTRDTSQVPVIRAEIAHFREVLEPYRDEPLGRSLSAEIEEYAGVFEQLVKRVEERGLNENLGAEGRLRASVLAIEEAIKEANEKDLMIAMLQARRFEKDYIMRGEDKYVDLVKKAVADIKEHTRRSRLNVVAKADLYAKADAYQKHFVGLATAMQDIKALKGQLEALEDASNKELGEMVELKEAAAERAKWFMIIATFLCIGLGVVVAVYVARSITRPVKQLEAAADRIAAGDLDQQVEVDSQDEIGKLAASFNTMVQQVREALETVQAEKAGVEKKVQEAVAASEEQKAYLAHSVETLLVEIEKFAEGDLTIELRGEHEEDEIGRLYDGINRAVSNIRSLFARVRSAVEETMAAAVKISGATEELAAGAQEQSAQAGEVAAAVEQMTRTIIENAQNATHTAEAAQKNGQVAEEGGVIVSQTVDKIRQIAERVGTSAQTVERLGASSEQIGQIVRVIDEIADQTNLLALNAAIEAARAGDQGRGFAVVADEVRKLAERTTDATKQIAGMIEAIQKETAEAVQAMQVGTQEVEEGITLADDAGNALGRIVDETQETVDMINLIAAATEEQSTTSEQISRSVEAISTVSEESARGVGEIARSTDELNQLMDEVRTLVNRFRVEADAPAHGPGTPDGYGTDRPAAAPPALSGDGWSTLPAHP